MTVTFRPLADAVGAEVVGFDSSLDLDEATFSLVRDGWLRHSVLLFRDVQMTPVQHIAFTRRLGPLHIVAQGSYSHPDHPEIFVISNRLDGDRALGMRRVGLGWHTDGEDQEIPNAGSFLYAQRVPPVGGDTYFAGLYTAYDALSAAMKSRIAGRKARYSRVALHSIHYPEEPPLTKLQIAARPDVFHPLVRSHPVTKRKSLYIGRWACGIVGMCDQEAKPLLAELLAFATQEQFVYRHRWRRSDALLWDNRCVLHHATEFDESRHVRHMHRTTLEGDRPY